jgi:C4-dicarboxylate-specific signal transduction histidine kinase
MARRYALIIGIQDYKYISPLTKTRDDARSVADFLRATGDFQDVFVVRSDATRSDLVAALKEFQDRARGNDALVYFTGHGFGLVDELTDGVTGYLAAADTRVETTGNRVTAQQDGIPLASLGALLEQGNFSSLVMLLDACHSGLLLERGEIEQGLAVFSRKRDYFLITACRGFEQAAAIGDQPHSLFTGAVLGGLARENADDQGKVSADRLFDFVARSLRESGQEPLRLGMGSGIGLVDYGVAGPVVRAVSEENPYQGLAAFTKETRQFFFGRDREIEMLVEKVQQCGFVPLIGASGSGKSSVVRAGLIPRLEDLGWRVLEPMKPGAKPIYELQRTFDPLFDRRKLAGIHECIERDGLQGIVNQLPQQKHLLVIDQFEEVFTLLPDRSMQRHFIKMLMGLENNGRLTIVTTIRSDFVQDWLEHEDLVSTLYEQAVWMSPLQEEELRKAIIQPAKLQNYTFEAGLLDMILKDVEKERNYLPLLELCLTQLWENASKSSRKLKTEQFGILGGVSGVLNQYATELYEILNPTEKIWMRRICLKLIRTNEENRDTRQRQLKQHLMDLGAEDEKETLHSVLEILINSRLVATDVEDSWIELTHEGLIEKWDLLNQWRSENRDIRRLVDKIEDGFSEWIKSDKNNDFLLAIGLQKQCRSQWQDVKECLSYSVQRFCELSAQHWKNIYIQNQELENHRQKIRIQSLQMEETQIQSQFLATTVHELRTPMHAILGFSQLLLRQNKLSPMQVDMVHRILNNGENVVALIDDILDLSMIETGRLNLKRKRFRIDELLVNTTDELRSLADQKKLKLVFNSYLEDPYIINDRDRLRQVIVNLLSNAIKFTEEGTVALEVREINHDRIVILVSDMGIGIASEEITRIFEEFYKVDKSANRNVSTGLGLSITRWLVQMMGGQISVNSQPSQGSTFRVDLPREITVSKNDS